MKSKKHLAGIARITADRKESQTIFQCLQRQDKQENASGTTLPANLSVTYDTNTWSPCFIIQQQDLAWLHMYAGQVTYVTSPFLKKKTKNKKETRNSNVNSEAILSD